MKRTNIYVTNRAKVKTNIIFINNKSKGKKLECKIANSFLKPISNTMENGFCSLSYSEY